MCLLSSRIWSDGLSWLEKDIPRSSIILFVVVHTNCRKFCHSICNVFDCQLTELTSNGPSLESNSLARIAYPSSSEVMILSPRLVGLAYLLLY